MCKAGCRETWGTLGFSKFETYLSKIIFWGAQHSLIINFKLVSDDIRWNVDQYWRYWRFSMILFPRRMSWILKHKIKLPVQIWKVQSYHEVPWTKITRVRNTIARGFGYTRAPWKASKPQSRHGTLKPQSRKAAMERASRKAAKLPWNAQAAKLPWNAQAAKPQSRKLPWNAQAAKPQSRHGTRKPQSRRAAKPPSRKLCDSCATSCVHRRCVATAMDRWSRKAASSETRAPSPVFIAAVLPERQEASKSRKAPRRRSTTKRQSGKASRSAKASRSVKASRSGTAPKRQRAANERLAVLRRGRACLRKEVCNQRLAVFRRGRACILRDNS